MTTITTLDELLALYGESHERSRRKELPRLIAPYRALIEASPFVVLASTGADGMDCSPRGDAPGFVQILDDQTLLLPDRPGNNRIDSLRNIVQNPQVALLFLIAWIEDNPGDPARQALMAGSWTIVFLAVEYANDWDFVLAPLVRFVTNWPSRIVNWATDPWRGGVPLEIIFVALIGWWAWRRVNRYLPRDAAVPAGTS